LGGDSDDDGDEEREPPAAGTHDMETALLSSLYAFSNLMHCVILFQQGSQVRGALSFRRAWKTFEALPPAQALRRESEDARPGTARALLLYRGMRQLGTGFFLFFMSYVPPRFASIVSLVGFTLDRAEGAKRLRACEAEKGPVAAFAAIFCVLGELLDAWTWKETGGLRPAGVEQARVLSSAWERRHPDGFLFPWVASQVCRFVGEQDRALALMERSLRNTLPRRRRSVPKSDAVAAETSPPMPRPFRLRKEVGLLLWKQKRYEATCAVLLPVAHAALEGRCFEAGAATLCTRLSAEATAPDATPPTPAAVRAALDELISLVGVSGVEPPVGSEPPHILGAWACTLMGSALLALGDGSGSPPGAGAGTEGDAVAQEVSARKLEIGAARGAEDVARGRAVLGWTPLVASANDFDRVLAQHSAVAAARTPPRLATYELFYLLSAMTHSAGEHWLRATLSELVSVDADIRAAAGPGPREPGRDAGSAAIVALLLGACHRTLGERPAAAARLKEAMGDQSDEARPYHCFAAQFEMGLLLIAPGKKAPSAKRRAQAGAFFDAAAECSTNWDGLIGFKAKAIKSQVIEGA
jgi:hypothetical protein